ncbi:MAG: hypothetical protein HKK67_13965 [Chlorobiaceae bacterium]|nr:hypothetical protein [Chlorobiaceae bacterium]
MRNDRERQQESQEVQQASQRPPCLRLPYASLRAFGLLPPPLACKSSTGRVRPML